MEYDLIEYIQSLLGGNIKGYVLSKPESTPYPAFVVEDSVRRGMDIYNNNGKSFDYIHNLQINLIGQKFSALNIMKNTVVATLDGFRGVLGTQEVVDCRLVESASTKNTNKNYEFILFFTLSTK
jgi:hypothetical protein